MTDQRLEKMVAWILRAGVMLAAAVVLGGGVWYILQHANQVPQLHKFQGEPAVYRSVAPIFAAAFSGDSSAIIQLGLVLLIATPVLRVALSLAGFALERDRTYMLVTAIVLAVLVLSLTGRI